MTRNPFGHDPKGRGFTFIELMMAVIIIAILAITTIPAYQTLVKNAELLNAKLEIRNALIRFGLDKGYSPATGMLADLVTYGYLDAIPNDPWTVVGGSALAEAGGSPGLSHTAVAIAELFVPPVWAVTTGTEEEGDWYYENDGSTLTLYPYSHPASALVVTSSGLPPFTSPGSGTSNDSDSNNTNNSNNSNNSNSNNNADN